MNEQSLAKVFTEWDLRYRNDPEQYMNTVDHLLGNTPYSYGLACARYFKELSEELGES